MITDLIPEIRETIFDYCSLDDLKNLSLTCKSNHQLLREKLFHTVPIPVSNDLKKRIERLQNTKAVSISVQSKGLGHIISKVNNLSGFSSRRTRLFSASSFGYQINTLVEDVDCHTDNMALHVTRCTLHDWSLTDESISQLVAFKNLNKLDIKTPELGYRQHERNGTSFTYKAMDHIGKLVELRELNLRDCWLYDHHMEGLAPLTKLVKLNLEGCFYIDGRVFSYVCFPALEKLCLAECDIDDEGLSHIRTLTQLKELDVRGPRGPRHHNDWGWHNLNALEGLLFSEHHIMSRAESCMYTQAYLEMHGNRIGDEGVRHISSLEMLEKIDLSYCLKITQEGIVYLDCLTNLKELTLTGLTHIDISQISSDVYVTILKKDKPNKQGAHDGPSIELPQQCCRIGKPKHCTVM